MEELPVNKLGQETPRSAGFLLDRLPDGLWHFAILGLFACASLLLLLLGCCLSGRNAAVARRAAHREVCCSYKFDTFSLLVQPCLALAL